MMSDKEKEEMEKTLKKVVQEAKEMVKEGYNYRIIHATEREIVVNICRSV